jgi:hypothetical protein
VGTAWGQTHRRKPPMVLDEFSKVKPANRESIGGRQKNFWRHPGSGLAEAVRWDFEKWGGIEFFLRFTEPFPCSGSMLMRYRPRKWPSYDQFSICERASHGRSQRVRTR